MGPLYHLQNKSDRIKALNEAHRVLKKGGLLIAAGISKFSSTTWALSVYGNGCDFIDDDIYMNMLKIIISLQKQQKIPKTNGETKALKKDFNMHL